MPLRAPSARASLVGLALLAATALSACDSKAERAEKHYQRAVAYLAEGEPDRATIELRNVFRLDPAHRAARLAYARLLRDKGDLEQALHHYGVLVDQDRNNAEAQRELAELALSVQDFDLAAAASRRAFELAPKDPAVRAVKSALDYRSGDRQAAVAMARGVAAETPGSIIAQMVLIADRMSADDAQGALAQADAALAAAPADQGLHLARLAALDRMGDEAAMGEELARMAELFPEDGGVARAQVRWLLAQGDAAGAEAALRARVARDPGDTAPALTVVQFLYEREGAEAAAAELDRLIAAAPDPLPYQRVRAGLDFAQGRQAEAIAALRALIEGKPPSDATRDVQVELAGMLAASGDAAGRDRMIAAALEGDPRHVGALKLRARAAIAADQPERAIQDMRAALTQAPRDPEIMTIMAEAHLREGARALAGERLALAVETSGQAPAESARYARFLLEDGKTDPAEAVLGDALRAAPQDTELLALLGETQLRRQDWVRAGQAAQLLREAGDPAAADRIDLARLEGEGKGAESLARLQALAATGDEAATAQLMETYAAAGDFAGARAWLDGRLAAEPRNLILRMMQAGLYAAEGEPDRAEALYRALIAETPATAQPYHGLAALLAGQGDVTGAEAALTAGLAATEDADLLFLQAGLLESRGNYNGAIAVYETLYARDSGNAVVANNLASLLTTQRADPGSLERAHAIARRLRGSQVPQFQDTYGWILHRRGDSAQAIVFLAPAAAALGDNALVQFHLGEALLATGRKAEARAQFERVLALAGTPGAAPAAQTEAARGRIAEIDAPPAAQGERDAAGTQTEG